MRFLLVIVALLASVLPPGFDPRAIDDPKTAAPVAEGAKGPEVVRAQILLDRAHFSCGEIDGSYGSNLTKAVAAFQAARNLPANGAVGPETWALLNQDAAPALIPYTIGQEDVAGPFTKVPADMMKQAALEALSFTSPEEGLGEKFHVSPGLLAELNPGKSLSRAGEQILVPNVLTMPPTGAAGVVVSKSQSAVMAYDAAGKMLAFYSATIGSEHDPLPEGRWTIKGSERNPWFHYNAELFWDAHDPNEKAKIAPGPNNPVGVVWIALSKEHYGIHGTPDPSRIGHAYSHGCIRLTNWDASELAAMVKPGMTAILGE